MMSEAREKGHGSLKYRYVCHLTSWTPKQLAWELVGFWLALAFSPLLRFSRPRVAPPPRNSTGSDELRLLESIQNLRQRRIGRFVLLFPSSLTVIMSRAALLLSFAAAATVEADVPFTPFPSSGRIVGIAYNTMHPKVAAWSSQGGCSWGEPALGP
jgi:hypothetical protein